jgi:type IV pilus assembly protein PilY1
MWKFDVSDPLPSKWKIAYGSSGTPAPLFTACLDAATCDISRQAITNKPQVGKVGKSQTTGGVMVYFGTGKYFEDADNNIANTKTQSFYGVWDECPLVKDTTGTHSCPAISGIITNVGVQKSSLVQQSIIAELAPSVAVPINIRVTSNSTVDYPTKKGWYMDFVNVNSTATPKANDGERIVSASLLRGGRIIFATLIPIPPTASVNPNDLCTAGSKSTSWMMELDALSGSRLSAPALDITKNGKVDSSDVVTVTVNGVSITVPASGIKMTNGSTKTPAV